MSLLLLFSGFGQAAPVFSGNERGRLASQARPAALVVAANDRGTMVLTDRPKGAVLPDG